jgi:hypothetical protein
MAILFISEYRLYCNLHVSNIYDRRIGSPSLGENLAAEVIRNESR